MSEPIFLEFPDDINHIPNDWVIFRVDGSIIQPTGMPGQLFRGAVGWLLAQLRQHTWSTPLGDERETFPICLCLNGIYLETCLGDERWSSVSPNLGVHRYSNTLMVCLGYSNDRKLLESTSKTIKDATNYIQPPTLIDVDMIRNLATRFGVGPLWGSNRKTSNIPPEPEGIGLQSYSAYCATVEAIIFLLYRVSNRLPLTPPTTDVEGVWLESCFKAFDPTQDADSTLLLLNNPTHDPARNTEQRLEVLLGWFRSIGSLDNLVRLYLSALFGCLDSVSCLRHLAEHYLRYRELGAEGTLPDSDISRRIVAMWKT